MPDNTQQFNGAYEDKSKVFKNGTQSATYYVQNAIDKSNPNTQDATQNLINNIMKKRRK